MADGVQYGVDKVSACILLLMCTLRAQPPIPNPSELRAFVCAPHRTLQLGMRDTVFFHEQRLRPAIRALLRDQKCAAGARETLALIGEPEDLRLIIRLAPPPHPAPL